VAENFLWLLLSCVVGIVVRFFGHYFRDFQEQNICLPPEDTGNKKPWECCLITGLEADRFMIISQILILSGDGVSHQ
jgi:hypothetical protein